MSNKKTGNQPRQQPTGNGVGTPVAAITPISPVGDTLALPSVENQMLATTSLDTGATTTNDGDAPAGDTGETTAPATDVIAPDAPVVETTPLVPLLSELEEYLYKRFPAAKSIPAIVRQVEQRLQDYANNMGSTQPVTHERMVDFQTGLFTTYLYAIGAKDGAHYMALETVLFYFNKYSKDCFKETKLFRGSNDVKLYTDQRGLLMNLHNLFIATANPAKRKEGLRSINLQRTVDSLPDNAYRSNLTSFYLS